MKYTQIPTDTFQTLQLNAGVLLSDFDPSDGSLTSSDILGATTGGISFTATPTYSDLGEDIDNCPKNTKELKILEYWEVALSGTFVAVKPTTLAMLVAAGDLGADDMTITPRNDLDQADFQDVWWVGDYSNKNTGEDAGFLAIHVMNALSTGGFSIQSSDRAKGTYSFEFTGHYSINDQDTPPFEIFQKAGAEGATGATN